MVTGQIDEWGILGKGWEFLGGRRDSFVLEHNQNIHYIHTKNN
jgi:hypothetical protein